MQLCILQCFPDILCLQELDRRGPVDPYDPYYGRGRDPYLSRPGPPLDPFLDRDPLYPERRLPADPYGDPYARDPLLRDRGLPVPAREPERAFVPAESIDYGHGQSSAAGKPATEEPSLREFFSYMKLGHKHR